MTPMSRWWIGGHATGKGCDGPADEGVSTLVSLAASEPERVGPVPKAMRLGRLPWPRATALSEATAHLDGFTAAPIATRYCARRRR